MFHCFFCVDLFHLLFFFSLSLMLFVQGPQGAQGGQGPPGQLGSKVQLSDACLTQEHI